MVFSSLFFTFAFLPVTVLLYHASGGRWRNLALLVASLFFYAWGEPVYVGLMCASIMVNYCLGHLLGKAGADVSKRRQLLAISLVFNLGCLVHFKYLGMILGTIASIGGPTINAGTPAMPIGISFYTFQALSYLFDVSRGKVEPQKSPVLFALYIAMFPQLVAGPIVSYADIAAQLADRSVGLEEFCAGLRRFLCGLAKKVLLANHIGLLWSEAKAMPSAEISLLMAWAGILAFALQIYFDFSGYSDMAIGLGCMFGFHFEENFRYPYISQSVSEFWRRWHISLGAWFREYVYIPLGGNRRGQLQLMRNLLVVWLLTGLWHGASWNFVLWGLYFGVLICGERCLLRESLARWPRAVRHLYALLAVVIGWVFFEFSNLTDMLGWLRALLGAGNGPLIGRQTIATLSAYAVLFMVCIVAATPWPRQLASSLARIHRPLYRWAETVYYCALMFWGTASLVGSTYNPFIYFRF